MKILLKNEQKKKSKKETSSNHYSVVGALSVNIYTHICCRSRCLWKNINN